VHIWCQRDLKRIHKKFLSALFHHRFRFNPDNYSIDAPIIWQIEYRISHFVGSEVREATHK